MRLICIIILTLIIQLMAQPVITDISGTFAHDSILTIIGKGFGNGNTKPLLWDDFDSSSNQFGKGLPDSPKKGTWRVYNPVIATYDTIQKHSGLMSCWGHRTNNQNWSGFDLEISELTYLYIFFWFRYNAYGNGEVKLLQVKGTRGGTCPDYHPILGTGNIGGDWWRSYIGLDDPIDGICTWPSNYGQNYQTKPSQNEWHLLEAILKQSSGDSLKDGSAQIIVDGEVQWDKPADPTRNKRTARWNLVQMLNGITNFDSSNSWIDDAYVNNTWARVMIGNSPLISKSTHREIQIPEQWNDTLIRISVNFGSFGPGEQKYLYIFDSLGNVNDNGILIDELGKMTSIPLNRVIRDSQSSLWIKMSMESNKVCFHIGPHKNLKVVLVNAKGLEIVKKYYNSNRTDIFVANMRDLGCTPGIYYAVFSQKGILQVKPFFYMR